MNPAIEIPELRNIGNPDLIGADGAIVVRVAGGTAKLAYAKSVDTVHHPASLAKLMTALLTVTATADLDQQVTVAEEDLRRGSGNVFSAGDTLNLHDALQALLVPSSNTAAETLARTLGPRVSAADGSSRDGFIQVMNRTAAEFGLAATQFANPSGLHDPAAVCTARDTLRLLVEALRYPELVDILGKRRTHLRIGGPRERIQRVTTSVHALDRLDVIAGKTGTLRFADGHFHLAAIADLGKGNQALLVLMGAHGHAGRDRDTDALLEHLRPAEAYPRYPGRAHQRQATRLNATELADIVDGEWTKTPDSKWFLRRLRSAQSAARSGSPSGLMVIARSTGRRLEALNDSTLNPNEVSILTDAAIDEQQTHFPVLNVAGIDNALNAIAQWHRQRYLGTVVAIAGGSERSRAAEYLRSVLSHRHRTWAPGRSSRNSLRSVQQHLVGLRTEPFAIFDVAPQTLLRTAQLVTPDVAVLTGAATADDSTLNGPECVSEIAAQFLTDLDPGTAVILDHDMPDLHLFAEHARQRARQVITYGSYPDADIRLMQHNPDTGHVDVDANGKPVRFRLSALDMSGIADSLAVLAVLEALGEDAEAFAAAFSFLPSQPERDQGRQGSISGGRTRVSQPAASSIASMSTPDHHSERAETVAETLGGTWIGAPSPDWRLEQLLRVPNARRANSRNRNVLVPVKNPERAIPRLERSALNSTAALLLVDNEIPPESSRFAALKVPSIDEALTTLAARRRQKFRGKVVAVTGSVGKSTTKTMVGHALSQIHDTFWTTNGRNGLPAVQDHCFRLAQERYAVVEIARIGLPEGSDLLRPDVAIVTAVSEAHVEAMGSLAQIAQIKAQIFTGMNPDGTAVVNLDTPHAEILIEAAKAHAKKVITYGTSQGADARLLDYDPQTQLVSANLIGTTVQYRISTPGLHNALNSVAALSAIRALGEDVAQFVEFLESVKLPTGRGGVSEVSIAGRSVTLVDQSHSANPTSMRAALEDFANRFDDFRRILVLGDMRELGSAEATFHADLLEPVTQGEPDRVYLVGPLMTHLWSRLPEDLRGAHVSTTAQLRGVLETDLRDGDAVLIKASRDTGLKKFVRSLAVNRVEGNESWRVTIIGPAVQKVGYRRWLQKRALQYDVDGWVRNSEGGKVEALLRGNEKKVAAMCSRLQVGPRRAKVDRVTVRRVSTVPRRGFRLRQTPPSNPQSAAHDGSRVGRWRTLAKRAASRFRSKRTRVR